MARYPVIYVQNSMASGAFAVGPQGRGMNRESKTPSEPGKQEEIRQFYDDVYYRDVTGSRSVATAWENRLAQRLEVGPGQAVLDVACGLGGWLSACAARGASVSGVDLSDSAIGVCSASMPGEFHCQSAERLPFADQSFDLVTCLGSLEHFLDPAASIREMIRVARPAAPVVLLVPNKDFLTRKIGLFAGTYQVDVMEEVRSLEEWRELFTGAGVEVVELWKDLHILNRDWITLGPVYKWPLRLIQALLLPLYPMKWQYQVYHFAGFPVSPSVRQAVNQSALSGGKSELVDTGGHSDLKILFISRAYPPVIGGIERQNYELFQALSAQADAQLIANRRGKSFLPFFLVYALVRGLFMAPRADVILLGDGVLAPLGWLLGKLTRRPVCCIIHGLDITYSSRLYQAVWVRWACPRLAHLFAVGNETIRQAVQRGIPAENCSFIPNGVTVPEGRVGAGCTPRITFSPGKFHVLTLGRLVERKGVPWFVEHVVPLLPAHIHYWIAGGGPCLELLEQRVRDSRLADRVTVLGEVSEEEKAALFSGADLFVQPNVPVEGDMEGFGLVVLEAAAAGLPVVASRLEGLEDAIADGINGVLVQPASAAEFAAEIEGFCADRDRARAFGAGASEYTLTNSRWASIAGRYLISLKEIVSGGGSAG